MLLYPILWQVFGNIQAFCIYVCHFSAGFDLWMTLVTWSWLLGLGCPENCRLPNVSSVITFTSFRVATGHLYYPALSVWFSQAEWYACIPRCGPALHTWAITRVVVLFILAGCYMLVMDWWDWTTFHWKVAINPSFLVFLLIQVG